MCLFLFGIVKFEERDNGVFIRKPDMDDLQYKLATEDQLRMYIISFAADYNDLSMSVLISNAISYFKRICEIIQYLVTRFR